MKPPHECASLQDIRDAIDAIDRDVIALLGRRGAYVHAATR
jgi:isochorismate pyruvate lyase